MGDTTRDKKIFVGGLSWKTGPDALRSYFGQFGETEDVIVVLDRITGRSKGHGFVIFKDAKAAARACGDLSPIIDGVRAICNLASLGEQNKRNPTSSAPQLHQHQHPLEWSGLPEPAVPRQSSPYLPPHRRPLHDQQPHRHPLHDHPPHYLPNFPSYHQNNVHYRKGPPNVPRVGNVNTSRNRLSPLPTEPLFGLTNQYGRSGEIGTKASTNIPFRLLQMAKELELGPAKHKNFVFSPCSIQLALSLAANGSTNSTLNEFLAFLEAKTLYYLNSVATELIESLSGTSEGGPKLSLAGGAWVDKSMTLKKTFKDKAASIYQAKAKVVDFQNNMKMAIQEVNRWAEAATNGLIESILPPVLPNNTRVVLANALYFKGEWRRKFEERSTRKSTFYLLHGNSVEVPFMTSREEQDITTFENFKILRLPYKNAISSKAALSMYIILPNEVHGIWHLIERVGCDPSFFEEYLRPGGRVPVRIFRIPKFRIAFDFEASRVLQSIGLKKCFTDTAEFDEMVPIEEENPGLKITHVFHRARIEVNEEGTEAAASTAVVMGLVGCAAAPPQPVNFVADHPFMFVVRDDNSGMVLFMGHIINPAL